MELYIWVKDKEINTISSKKNPYRASIGKKLYLIAAGIRTHDFLFTSPTLYHSKACSRLGL